MKSVFATVAKVILTNMWLHLQAKKVGKYGPQSCNYFPMKTLKTGV